MHFATGKNSVRGKSPRKCIYNVAAQEMVKHRAKFGWPPVNDVAAVTKPRRETRWNMLTPPEPISAVSGPKIPYCGNVWNRHCCLISFSRLSIHALVAKMHPNKVARWCPDGDFLAIFVGVPQAPEPTSAVSRPKFTILWGHVEDILLLNKFFFRLSLRALVAKIQPDKVVRWCPQMANFGRFFASCIFCEPRAAHSKSS